MMILKKKSNIERFHRLIKTFNILINNVILKNGSIMFSSNCVICFSKNSRFIKEQLAKEMFKIRSLGPLLI